MLSTATGSGIDPEPVIDRHHLTAGVDPEAIDAVLAALAGFQLGTGLDTAPPGLEPIAAAKLALGKSTLHWLARRLDRR